MTNDTFGDCGHIRALLNEYIDGELHEEQLQELEKHLAVCDACRSELEELSALKKLVSESALPSPGIAEGVMEKINSGKVKMQKSRRMFIPFGTIAALAAVLVFMAINRNIFEIFGDKTNKDSLSATQSVSGQLKAEGADTGIAATEGGGINEIMALPKDAQFAPPVKSAVPAAQDRQESTAVTGATESVTETSENTSEGYGDEFQVEMDMNALAQKIKEESGFAVPTSRTFSVHLPQDYTTSQLFEGMTTQEDFGIFVLSASDEEVLKTRLDSIPDALYNSYAEVPDSDKIAVIIIDG